MKAKLLAFGIVAALVLAGGLFAVEAERTQGTGPKKPGQDFSGPHFNLNIIGKKEGWNGNAGYNEDRHTMFVPLYTPINAETPNGETGITIWMSRGTEFAVLDGNAFDDDQCSFQLGPGSYKVYVCAKAKNPKATGENEPYTDIDAWIMYDEDVDGDVDWIFYEVGEIRVKGKQWYDITAELFLISGEFRYWDDVLGIWVYVTINEQWVFDFLDDMSEYWEDSAYFWQFDNHGNKLIKLRFYKD